MKKEYLKSKMYPHKSTLEWLVNKLGGQYKELCKDAIISITSKNGNLIQPLRKWTRTGHIQHIALLTPETGTFDVK